MTTLPPPLHHLHAHLTALFSPAPADDAPPSLSPSPGPWILYTWSLLFALLIPALSPADCVVQRVFNVESWEDERNVYFGRISVVDVIYVLWVVSFGAFAGLRVRRGGGRHPWGLQVLHYVFSCTIPLYFFGTLGIWVGSAREDYVNDYFHTWLAASLTMGVVVKRIIEYMIPERTVGDGMLGKAGGGDQVSKGEEVVRARTVEYPSRWMCKLFKGMQ